MAAFAFYLLAFIVLVVMPAAVVVGLAKLFSRPASPSARRWRIGLAALAYCVWLIVPLTVWAMGWTGGGGMDGPCDGLWASSVAEVGPFRCEVRLAAWPPLGNTATVASGGEVHQKTFPGVITYVVVAALAALPAAQWTAARRVLRG